jgi:hypothetical protein
MPLYCSNTGSTALREAEVQQPIPDATLSLTRSFFAFSANVGQSLPPSSWMNLILRRARRPRVDLLDRELLGLDRAGLADRHGAGDRMQDADGDLGVGHRKPVVLTLASGNCCAKRPGDNQRARGQAAAPSRSSRARE